MDTGKQLALNGLDGAGKSRQTPKKGKSGTRARPKQRELSEQIKIVDWARKHALQWPCLESALFHIPNGGARSPRQAATLKKAGVVRGIPDLMLAYPASGAHGLFVELKVGRNKPTPEQSAFIEYANAQGYRAVVCYGAEAAIRAIEDYVTDTMEPQAVCPF